MKPNLFDEKLKELTIHIDELPDSVISILMQYRHSEITCVRAAYDIQALKINDSRLDNPSASEVVLWCYELGLKINSMQEEN